jgi:hypothetical protein
VTASAKSDIKSLQLDELRSIAQPSYRARQITDWLYKKRVNSFAEMTDLPQVLREKLADDFSFDKIEVVRVLGSTDTTRKFLFRLSDGNLIESVLIQPRRHFTDRRRIGGQFAFRLRLVAPTAADFAQADWTVGSGTCARMKS